MNVEPTRQKEMFANCWMLPKGLTREQAKNYFLKHVKPSSFTMERWSYDKTSGRFSAI